MRWFYLAVVVLFVIAVILFAAQNRDMTTVAFLRMDVRMPLAMVMVVVYVLGALTGGSLLALLRRTVQAARRREASL
jgi:uncharacterized integral membrane protein